MSQPQIHSLTLSEQLRYSRETLETFLDVEKNPKLWKEKDISMSLFQDCKGVAILHMYKATFGIGGVMGTGIIMGRTMDGNWTAPISLSLNGAEIGLAIGVNKSEHVLIFKDLNALQIFMENGQIKLGTDVNVTLGTMGHDANVAVDFNKDGTKAANVVSYSVSSTGVYLGVSLEGILITANSDLHEQFYGRPVNMKQIYSGEVNIPLNEDYTMMINLLNKHIKPNETFLPKDQVLNSTDIIASNLNDNKIQENNMSSTIEINKTWDHLPQSKQYMWDKLKNRPHNNSNEQEVLPLNETQPQYKDKELLNEQIEPENVDHINSESQRVHVESSSQSGINKIIDGALRLVDRVAYPLQSKTQHLLENIHVKKIDEHRHAGANLFHRNYSVGAVLHEKKLHGDHIKSYPNFSNVTHETPATFNSLDNMHSTHKNKDVDFEKAENYRNKDSLDKSENESNNKNKISFDTIKKTGNRVLSDAHEKTNESVEKFKKFLPDKIKDHVPNQIKMPSSNAIEDKHEHFSHNKDE